jgi:hypothetical protein
MHAMNLVSSGRKDSPTRAANISQATWLAVEILSHPVPTNLGKCCDDNYPAPIQEIASR